MQRKLFRLDGREVLATRGGGLYETASTLQRLIAEGRQHLAAVVPDPVASGADTEPGPPVAVELPPTSAPVSVGPAAGAATLSDDASVAASVTDDAPRVAASSAEVPLLATEAPPKAPRRRRAAAAPVAPSPVPAIAPVMTPAAVPASPAARPRRAAAETPRWSTAGAERRGRAAVHWSKRGR